MGAYNTVFEVNIKVLFRIQKCTMQIITVRLLQMLALDRFNDFVSGSSATSPICEAGAQGISIILLRYSEKFPDICAAIFEQIKRLFALNSEDVSFIK